MNCRNAKKIWLAATLLGGLLALPSSAQAELDLVEADGWKLTSDGRVNGFVSHVRGDARPKGLDNLSWVAFDESGSSGQSDADGKLIKTRIRSGYVPSTLAFNLYKQVQDSLNVKARVEIGMQITTIDPTFVGDPTWMEPRAAYLDLSGDWGSVRAGRDHGVFGRSSYFMDLALGPGYGVGFPCSYDKVFGGACGHAGFGIILPDFRAQISYTTPKLGDMFSLTVGVFDPRTAPSKRFDQTPTPRVETEALLDYSWSPGFGVKAWGSGFYQGLGTTVDVLDAEDMPTGEKKDVSLTAFGAGGGLQIDLGPFRLGGAGHMGEGIGPVLVLTHNRIYLGTDQVAKQEDTKFRPIKAFLGHVSYQLGDTWLSLGYGQTLYDRIETDELATTPDSAPLIRSQTGISAGLFHRVDSLVFGLDFFNANYDFDARVIKNPAGFDLPPLAEENSQNVSVFNLGATWEW